MQRWEYCDLIWASDRSVVLFHRRNSRDPEGIVAALGEDGWELVGIVNNPAEDEERWVFKRPVG